MKTVKIVIVSVLLGFVSQVQGQVTVSYTYDDLNRLTQASYSNGVGIQYSYDALGNRTQETKTSTLSIEDVSAVKNLKLHPNPFKDELHLSSDNHTIKEVSIIDITGKLIKTITNISATTYQLDASYLTTGNYLIQIKTDEGVEVHKVIKK